MITLDLKNKNLKPIDQYEDGDDIIKTFEFENHRFMAINKRPSKVNLLTKEDFNKSELKIVKEIIASFEEVDEMMTFIDFDTGINYEKYNNVLSKICEITGRYEVIDEDENGFILYGEFKTLFDYCSFDD